jgi:DNA replication protein DnaC
MAEELFAVLSRMPGLAEAMKTYCPDELEQEALDYVHLKWPHAGFDEIRALDVLRVKRQEAICANCTGDTCPVGRPYALSRERSGRITLVMGFCGSKSAKAARRAAEIKALIRASGLSEKQEKQTFAAYKTDGLGRDVAAAKARAMRAASDGSWLALAGRRGSGKTHLAAAVLLDVIERGKAGLFLPVAEALDGLREGNRDGTYQAKMERLKTCPCLVLDDLGKERDTEAGLEYLAQIIDHRYRYERQTIITTNASEPAELARETNAGYLGAFVSRISEVGVWCSIRDARDYRNEIGKVRFQFKPQKYGNGEQR